MTDFRQMHSLHAYSGGTVRDSHPVLYSPVGLLPRPQALKRNIYLRTYHTRFLCKSQSKESKCLILRCVYLKTSPINVSANKRSPVDGLFVVKDSVVGDMLDFAFYIGVYREFARIQRFVVENRPENAECPTGKWISVGHILMKSLLTQG